MYSDQEKASWSLIMLKIPLSPICLDQCFCRKMAGERFLKVSILLVGYLEKELNQ